MAFLRFVTECHDDRRHHVHTKRHDGRRTGTGALFFPDMALHRAPPRAAVFNRPAGADPALLGDDLVPANEVFLGKPFVIEDLLLQVLGQIRIQEGANLVAEGQVFRRVIQVHIVSSLTSIKARSF